MTNKTKIIDAAYTLFIEKGYQSTSLRDIGSDAEVSQGGIYAHFPNKEAIYVEVLKDRFPFRGIGPLIKKHYNKPIELFFKDIAIDWINSFSIEEFRLVFIDHVEFKGKHLVEYFKQLDPDSIEKRLSKIFQQSKIKKGLPKEKMLFSFKMLITMINQYLLMHSLMCMDKKIDEKDVLQIVDLFLYGILEREGEL
jgi:AcrR family transcriptional regulator